jgi:WD40 repeat protein
MVAIASEPEDRYATVAEFQEAIRDYRRHAESVAQTLRADATLSRAIEQQDYESFSRAVFGFSSALELWPENQRAIEGLNRARLAYGRSALERNDFDLALQVLRPDVEEERPLIEAAKAGKLQAQQRVARIRRLTSTLAVGGGAAALVFLGLSLWAMYEKGKATDLANQQIVLKDIAQERTRQAQASEAASKESERRALASEAKAKEALEGERKARSDLASKNDELNEKNDQLDRSATALANSLETQRELTKAAELAASAEKVAREEADVARVAAVQQQKRAEQARLLAELRNYPANLSLAAIQIQQRDVGRTVDILGEVENVERVFSVAERGPKTDNWALGRIRLATNQDLPKYRYGGLDGRVVSADIDGRANLVGIGGADGGVELVGWNGKSFERVARLEADQCGGRVAVGAIAIVEAGRWIAFSKKERSGDVVYFWEPASGEVSYQLLAGLAVSDLRFDANSKSLIAVLQGGGVRVWDNITVNVPTEKSRAPKVLGQYALLGLELARSSDAGSTGVIGANAVGLVAAGESQYLGLVDLQAAGGLRVLRSEKAREQKYVELELVNDDYLILGELEGRLQIARVLENRVQLVEELRDDIHRTRITTLAASMDTSRFLSVGLEPVIQVWERDGLSAAGSFVPLIQLVGHRAEAIVTVDFAGGSDSAISVDEGGSIIYWDLKRQAERQVMARSEPASIIFAGGLGTSGLMRSVDAGGVVSSWRGVDGGEVKQEDRYQFVGHSPQAALQDLGVTPDGRFAITSAVIEAGQDKYLRTDDNERRREFCLWDFDRRAMLRRWSDRRRGYPCVAISADGTRVAIGSNGEPQETVIVDVATGIEQILVDDKGLGVRADDLEFREANGTRLTTVAYGGMVAEFDANSGYKILQYNRDFLDPPTSSSQIVAAEWSGAYFTVLFNSGHVRIFTDNENGQLISVGNLGIGDLRLQRGNVDFLVVQGGSQGNQVVEPELLIASRETNRTQVVTVLGSSDGAWKVSERKTVDGSCWVSKYQDGYRLLESGELAAGVGLEAFRDCVFLPDSRYCVTTAAGTVVCSGDGGNRKRLTLGRSDCVAADGDAAADRLVIGGAEGQIWRGDFGGARTERESNGVQSNGVQSNGVQWQAFSHPLVSIEQIRVAPRGQSMAVLGKTDQGSQGVWCQHLDEETDTSLWIDGAVACQWNPGDVDGASELSVVLEEASTIRCRTYRVEPNGVVSVVREGVLAIGDGKRVTGLEYFGERFADVNQPTKWYQALLVQSASNEGSEVLLVAEDDWGVEGSQVSAVLRLPSQKVTSLTGSATDGLLATGDREGAVSVWFLAPSIDQQAFELLTIDRHRGQPISCLAFSEDGSQLVTADEGGRQFTWLAADPLEGLARKE